MFGKKNNINNIKSKTESGKWVIRDIIPAGSSGVRPFSPKKKITEIKPKEKKEVRELTPQEKLPPRRRSVDLSGFFKIFKVIPRFFGFVVSIALYPARMIKGSRGVISYSEPKMALLGNKKYIIPSAVVLILIIGLFVVDMISSSTLKITPRQQFLDITSQIKGTKSVGGDMLIEMISFKKVSEMTGPTTGMKDVSKKASGTIVIYNAYSSDSQMLIRRTRFEAPDGKIYRIPSTITVPGAEIKDGKIVPSSIEVEVFADKAGDEYNRGLTDFTIPGFKGTARYSKFYARSKTEIAGGFIGVKQVATEEDIERVTMALKQQIKDEIFVEYNKQIPEGFVLLDDAYKITYNEELVSPPVDGDGTEVLVRLSGIFSGLLFSRDAMSDSLAQAYLGNTVTDKVSIENINDLNKSITSIDFERGEMVIAINGRAHMVWDLDEESLKKDFLEKEKSVMEIFNSYEVIEKAEVVFWPSWWHLIPRKIDKIHIERVLTPLGI